jgi:hypothetical protein
MLVKYTVLILQHWVYSFAFVNMCSEVEQDTIGEHSGTEDL